MSTHQNIQGSKGEELVCEYLRKRGFTILACNYRLRCGEIDIIAQQKNLIVFVEVKLRQKHFFDLSTVVTSSKQRKIIITAELFLIHNKLEQVDCRFDVALVEPDLAGNLCITYLENAFQGDQW